MTILKPWPEHQNPSQGRTASAPYNFVPLPEKIVPAVADVDKLPNHDKYYPDLNSGYFDVTLTTRSPLYMRGPVSAKDFPRQESDRKIKNKPEFFYISDEDRPVIPGSSLRGMLRALLEIVSYSKMKWVSKKQLFFRTVDKTAIGQYYRGRMGNRVETGFLVRRGDTYCIRVCSMARVNRSIIGTSLYSGTPPNQVPVWQGEPRQYAPVWVRIRASRRTNIVERLSYKKRNDMVEGRLVITGDVPDKTKEFVFLLPADNAEEIPVPDDIISCFPDGDQITQWQEEAFPIDQPASRYRERHGMVGTKPALPGDPIFFLRENRQLTFIGRARMFRLPYTRSPFDLVDQDLYSARYIDYAEALFGFALTDEEVAQRGANIPQGDKRRAYASRVIVTDGVLQTDSTDIWLAGDFKKDITPRILATPKPTAFQQYLTQRRPDDPGRLDHYDSGLSGSDKPTIRGHKLYWHQGLGTDQDLGPDQGLTLEQIHDTIEEPDEKSREDDQHIHFKPLKPGVEFSFRVYFENLSDSELGALCWTLHPHGEPGQRYCHHLGMGKPLGMGAVELDARLHIIDRPLRYKKLFFNDSGDSWQSGEEATVEDLAVPEVLAHRTQPFEEHLLRELNPDPPCTRLADMLRIAILLKLLEWPGYRAIEGGPPYLRRDGRPNTRYMKIQDKSQQDKDQQDKSQQDKSRFENEYRDRLVLPGPTQFDESYFRDKSRPKAPPEASQADQVQVDQTDQPTSPQQQHSMPEPAPQAANVEQAPAENNRAQPALPPKLAELAKDFHVGRELSSMTNYTQTEQGVEVRFWQLDPAQIIGFIPKELLIGRQLGPRISVVVTGLHQGPNGRLVVELKLRTRR